MFEKIANNYPDPSVSMEEVHTRIALCQSFLGDVKAAEVSLAKADEIQANTDRAEMVRKTLGNLVAGEGNVLVNSNWQMRLGDSRRYGTTLAVPDEFMLHDLAAVWQYYYEPKNKFVKGVDVDGIMLSGQRASGKSVLDTRMKMERDMIDKWRDKTWRPAGNLLIDGDRVFFKTGGDLSVWSRKKVEKLSQLSVEQTSLDRAIAWRSVWRNAFQIDYATSMANKMAITYGGSTAQNRVGHCHHPPLKSSCLAIRFSSRCRFTTAGFIRSKASRLMIPTRQRNAVLRRRIMRPIAGHEKIS